MNPTTNKIIKSVFKQGAISSEFIGESIAKHQTKTTIGAHNIFLGQVRADVINNKTIKAIEYTAHEEMANKKFYEIREAAFQKHGIIQHQSFGKIIGFEVNGYGSFHMMDDANVPSLLSLPYLGAIEPNNPLYLNTRKVVLSENNPFFYKGKAGEGIGGPHTGADTIWPMSIILRAITSVDDKEITHCVRNLMQTHAGTGFMHESFHKDDASKFTRKWFAWANTLFGELIYKLHQEKPGLLQKI